jgi:hypothetical protein
MAVLTPSQDASMERFNRTYCHGTRDAYVLELLAHVLEPQSEGLQAAAFRAWGPPSNDGGRMAWRDDQTQVVMMRYPNGPVDLRVRSCPEACR